MLSKYGMTQRKDMSIISCEVSQDQAELFRQHSFLSGVQRGCVCLSFNVSEHSHYSRMPR